MTARHDQWSVSLLALAHLADGRQDIALTVGGARVPELIALALPASEPAP